METRQEECSRSKATDDRRETHPAKESKKVREGENVAPRRTVAAHFIIPDRKSRPANAKRPTAMEKGAGDTKTHGRDLETKESLSSKGVTIDWARGGGQT